MSARQDFAPKTVTFKIKQSRSEGYSHTLALVFVRFERKLLIYLLCKLVELNLKELFNSGAGGQLILTANYAECIGLAHLIYNIGEPQELVCIGLEHFASDTALVLIIHTAKVAHSCESSF